MQPTTGASAIYQIMPIIFLFIMAYLFIIKPQKEKQKEHATMLSKLKKNDEVVISGGIHGTVVGIKDKTFVLRVDENTKVEVDKEAIAYVKKVR
ncbi:MAG: preprotein translocase subunit YajC [Candidatus Omnitrophica bacterium]|nr:preprotein translocase subunit YajC [Candidatus Omnitrophota bacterium]MCK5288561.1 preprotein translocase subunit YajC [Candidatus Omnitrophota bacterium]